ncbi:MAG: class I SAM-dependent methyltransferase [Defluviitaleaceae bacterium]|nr:class I SAM-dependent methyltransferase [Defluviitaleaceae bacterium]
MTNDEILLKNRTGWDTIADYWFGATALPEYGPTLPKEDALRLFGGMKGKKILDIGCGSGHSLLYNAKNGAAELWGLDLSSKQIENAGRLLAENGVSANLFVSPMEENPGIPEGYFDYVYSVYAFGWTLDLSKSVNLVYKYLKPSGTFIFSWDNPLMQCIRAEDGKYVLFRSYLDEAEVSLVKAMQSMVVRNWKLSSYINALAAAGFKLERLVEETDAEIVNQEQEFTAKYYSKHKAQFINESFIIKATKL